MNEVERYTRLMQMPNRVFVFGSNVDGHHIGGAAAAAHRFYGAILGQGEGLQGRSYAIPTMDLRLGQFPIAQIKQHVQKFLEFARANPDTVFIVSRVGCGIAGFKDAEIAPMFDGASDNVAFPIAWEPFCRHDGEFPA